MKVNVSSQTTPVRASCHCGGIELTLVRPPTEVVECHCSLCRRYGVLWAYYEVNEIQGMPGSGTTDSYAWGPKNVDFHRCVTCGCLVLWAPRAAGRTMHGINARLLPPEVLRAATIRQKTPSP